MPKAQDEYGSLGSVPTVQNTGVSGAHESISANVEDFGGQVGQALTNAGSQATDISQHFLQMTTEAKVNDDYANKYVPAAAQLRTQYDSLRGQDKVAGYEDYVKGLGDLNTQFTSAQSGIIGQKSMSGLIDKHIEGEIFGAKRELVESQKQFADQSSYDMIKANIGMAAQNYSNPDLVNSIQDQNDNHTLINHIDNGFDPNHPVHADIIEQAQKSNTGQMATAMIGGALSSGDALSANYFRGIYSDAIPGYQKLAVDNTLHTANIQQTSANTMNALTTGKTIPDAVGAPASKVQALVADTAKSSAVDPNDALTVLRIESANGQNLGARGTLGQDKGSAGKPIEDQAQALCDNLKMASTQTTNALGRQAEPWESYVTYQQGAGGGPALLKAAQDDPDGKAIDVLSKLYDNPKDALSAITGNGGNITMSTSDFVDHIKQVYTDNSKRANCDFGNATTPGDSILSSHQTPGPTIQPAASPTQALLNFDKKAPAILSRINAIPSVEQRAGVMKAYNQERQRYSDSANAYTAVLVNQAGQLAADPKFTSMDQVPPEMQAALAADHPQTLNYMETRAQHNLDKASGNTTKDMREYGNGFYDLFNAVHASADSPNRINSITDLQKHVGVNGDLTIAGYDRLSKELQGKNTPDGDSEGIMKKQFFANAKQEISGKDEALGIKDPKGEENYLRFMAQALPAYEAGKGAGKTSTQLLNPDSPDYIGKSISSFKRSLSQQLADMETGVTNTNASTPEGLKNMVATGKITRAEGEAIALKNGYIRAKPTVTVPLAE